MNELLQADNFTVQSKFRWFPSLNTKFQLLDDTGEQIGEITFHPAWMSPVLWIFGLLLEVGLVVGGVYQALIGADSTGKLIGLGLAIVGLFFLSIVSVRTFLSSRASSVIEIHDKNNELVIKAVKGWALFRAVFSIYDMTGDEARLLGESAQSVLWGDRRYMLWDAAGKRWGTIRRRPFGLQYRGSKGSKQVGRFRRKLIDARRLVTGMKSYTLEFQDPSLTQDERALVLGSLTYVDVLVRQKRMKEDSSEVVKAKPVAAKA